MVLTYEPGDRFELNEQSGNPGRKGFVLRCKSTNPTTVLVRFDGFAYNSWTDTSYMVQLPAEPFRVINDERQSNG
jgi:hypothetical protein